jgi:putative heme-binding domain-containing protein
LKLAEADELPVSLAFTAGEALRNVRWKELRARARLIFPAPSARDSVRLPPISKLVQRKGNIQNGESVFFNAETVCATCHRINGRGTDFGPDLSEIGAKLAPEALYESILDPNAGVSFGYEAVVVELKSGDEAYGIIISETKDELTLKAVGGIVSSYSKSTIVNREMQQTSIMPIGLQQTMTTDEFVDLIEYLVSLKHAK